MRLPYNKKQLLNCIQSDIEIVAIWGAFQILKLEDSDVREFLPYFLGSPFLDIQDAGLAKIAETKEEAFTADIIRVFRSAEGQIKYTAAYTLSNFPNDITRTLIQKWFEQLSSNNQATRIEFDAAVYAFINLNRDQNYQVAYQTLCKSQGDIIKSVVLFTNLLLFCKTEKEYNDLIDQYFILRDQFSDTELTLQLIETLVFPALREWWATNLSKGYSINSIFKQCYSLLGIDEDLTAQHYWNEFESAIGDSDRLFGHAIEDSKGLILATQQWLTHLLDGRESDVKTLRLKWIIDAFYRNAELLNKTIPKIVELEVQFLLSIPLFVLLEKAFNQWLANPADYVERIANYYHSTLLIKEYRERILDLFFPELPNWKEEELLIKSNDSPVDVGDNKNGIIWSFYRGELLGYRVPWPTIFPNPDISRHLADGLAKHYYANFSYFIKEGDKVAIDYALQLFQLRPQEKAIELIHSHFDYLYKSHTETLYQTIEYLPDSSFFDVLLKKHSPGEREVSRLLLLISKVADLELPEEIKAEISSSNDHGNRISGVKKPLRLHCSQCSSSYQYPVEVIYIDESSILRSNRLTQEAIWVPHGFKCKNCHSDVQFHLEPSQLDELSQQSRVDRILKITPQSGHNHFGYQTSLIDFPRYNGKLYSPGEFIKFMSGIESDSSLNSEELKILWMKLARLQSAMANWLECRSALEKVKSLEKIDEEWMYLMGLVFYKLSSFAESRKYFDWILKKYPEELPQSSFTPYVEKSRFYINQLNSKSSKKALFKVITGKK